MVEVLTLSLQALDIAGPSKKPRGPDHSDKMPRALAELAAKPRTLEVLIKVSSLSRLRCVDS